MIRKSHGVALAALALAASSAFAQSSVKVYGMLDLSVGEFKTAHAPSVKQPSLEVASGKMMTSYIGFSGSEDLGSGLKAEFALESFLGADTGQAGGIYGNLYGGWWSRTSNVALSGGFGKVALGQYDNALFTLGYTYSAFGSSMQFSPAMRHFNYVGQMSGTPIATRGGGVGFDTGWVNSITYETPDLGGFTGSFQFAPKESTKTDAKNSFTLAGAYNAGPLSVSALFIDAGNSQGANTAYTAKEKVFAVGASYDFGVVKALFQYAGVKDDTNPSTAVGNKDKIWELGVTAPLGGGSLLATYGQLKNKVDGAASLSDKLFSVGYDYNLSKRTDTYVALSNSKQTDLKSGTAFAVGLRHNF